MNQKQRRYQQNEDWPESEDELIQENDSIEGLIDSMLDVVHNAKSMPLSSKCFVDREWFMQSLNNLNRRLPQEFANANNIIKHHRDLLDGTRREAQQLVDDATARAAQMTNEHEITLAAHVESERIMREAETFRQEMRAEAFNYARNTLGDLEQFVEDMMLAVRDSKKSLDKNS